MIDVAIWLLRWTLAGAMVSSIVLAAAYVLERRGRAAGLHLYRTALLAVILAPLIAFAPPMLTPSAWQSTAATQRAIAQLAERPEVGQMRTPGAEQRGGERPGDVALNVLAIALIGLWSAGSALGALRRQRSAARLSRAFRDGAPYPTSFVACRLSADAPAPLIFGLLRPRMLAPADFPEWSPAERESVLRHEAAHLRRGDLVWAALGDAVSALYWWMPPVRTLTRQHILATEEACDSASLTGD
ncbi:MAG TPA: M56 family metallopeptidase, partial [Candidatus Binatia bacterium]|nr:M56 family metallopeptidase [Candidatus Binatia bacterium]